MNRERRGVGLAAGLVVLAWSGCALGPGLEDVLSVDADETETISRNREWPDVPEGMLLQRSVWYEAPQVTATDVNEDVAAAILDVGGQVTCDELPPRPDSEVPVHDCSFVWTDGRQGTYTLEGGGPVPADQDVDGIAIVLNASYPPG